MLPRAMPPDANYGAQRPADEPMPQPAQMIPPPPPPQYAPQGEQAPPSEQQPPPQNPPPPPSGDYNQPVIN